MNQTPASAPPPTGPNDSSGIHFIGEKDPRNLSSDEFEKSPDLLYHWALKPFSYMQHIDSNIPDYFLEDKDKETLGQGFYTTPQKVEAQVRSRVRQGSMNTLPILISLLPYQARMFDLRDRLDPLKNGPVPISMAQRWLQFFTDYFRSKERSNLPWTITNVEEKYFLYLKEVILLQAIDLRVMLGTVPFSQSPNLPNPPWSKVFANFVTREGVDGLIYNEPSIANSGTKSPIFVFYNLTRVGTYESWHNPQVADSLHPS